MFLGLTEACYLDVLLFVDKRGRCVGMGGWADTDFGYEIIILMGETSGKVLKVAPGLVMAVKPPSFLSV